MKTKICTVCGIEKPLSEFNKGKNYKLGVRSSCRECEIKYSKDYRKLHKDKIIEYSLKNKEKIQDYHKSWYKENKEIQLASCHKRYKEKREQILGQCKDYYQSHKKEIKMYPSSNPDQKKDRYLQRLYGITLEQYNQMLESQNRVCAICGQPETTVNKRGNCIQDLSVDHNHETGKVRGLLCRKCNRILGDAKEDINIFNSATNYLNLHRG
jgi:hypothetical protein